MINYKDIGKGEVLVLIHGLGQYSKAWDSQLELANNYRLIIVDLRGHGESSFIKDNLTLKYMAKDIIELLEQLQIKSCYLLGLSLGGLVAQEVYRQREDLVSGIILCNTTFYISSYFVNKIVKKSEKLFNEDKDKLISYVVSKAIHNQDYFEEAKQTFYLSDVYLDAATSGAGYNYFPLLLRYNKPLLLIGGNYDNTTPLMNQVIMRWLCPRAKLITFDCGHLSNIECRDGFNQAIREFIGGEVNE